MGFTAQIRTWMIGLIGLGLTWLAQRLAVQLDVSQIAESLGAWLWVVLSGVVALAVNKLGSKYTWISWFISLGRSTSPSIYVPTGQDSVTATVTPPGSPTMVESEGEMGTTSEKV